MPEIKLKHVVSFSSEDKVHKAENLMKPETYRKWKCATPGEKSANVVLQFEKATQIHSIDIGNESSAFIEILVGRSSDPVSNFQVLLVASSFMSPLESRSGSHTNRVRMFGPEKLSQNTKEEKWDCVQIVCTQPFNKTLTYGLTFIKFHSPPEKIEEQPKKEVGKTPSKIGPFRIKYEDDEEEESLPSVGSWFGMKKRDSSDSSNSINNKDSPSYATAVLAAKDSAAMSSSQSNNSKRKTNEISNEPPAKKPTLNKDNIIYKKVLDDKPNVKAADGSGGSKKSTNGKTAESKKPVASNSSGQPTSSAKPAAQKKVPFDKLMENVIIVLSGFVNPLRSDIRDKALDMGAKYKADWDSTCTHLICAFLNTPKYTQVQKLNGKIVTKEWIFDCYKKKQLLPWKKYVLEEPSDDSSESEAKFTDESEDDDYSEDLDDSGDEYVVEKKKKKGNKAKPKAKTKGEAAAKKKNPSPAPKVTDSAKKDKDKDLDSPSKKGGLTSILNKRSEASGDSNSPSMVQPSGSRDESETEDEEAIQDYMAKTDVDESESCDTEDEIRKVEEQQKTKKQNKAKSELNGVKMETELSEKPDISDLPLPELPNLFKQKHFFLYGDFNHSKQHDLQRYITAYNGVLEDYMCDKVKYVITEKKWDQDFDEALSENEDLIFVKSAWIYKCHEAGKLVPYQPFIIIPDS